MTRRARWWASVTHYAALVSTQRQATVLLLVVFVGYLAYRAATHRAYTPDPLPDDAPLANQLADQIDPNTADAGTLSVLPGLGEKRAQDLIAFRDRRKAAGEKVPFKSPSDLGKIKGIGPNLINQLEPYLRFPTTRPAERNEASIAVRRPQ